MLQEIEKKLTWVFCILPGFLSTFIIGQIVDLGQLTEFQITFYSVALTLVNLCIALPLFWLIKSILSVKFVTSRFPCLPPSRIFDRGIFFYITIVVVSIIIGIFIGLAAQKDVFFATLRTLPITKTLTKRSSSRPLVFLLSQNSSGRLKEEGDARPSEMKKTEAWLKVGLKSGKVYEGWPEFFEMGEKPSELYLSPACEWSLQHGKELLKPLPGPGIVIFEREIETITFIDREESRCFAHWFGGKKSGSGARN